MDYYSNELNFGRRRIFLLQLTSILLVLLGHPIPVSADSFIFTGIGTNFKCYSCNECPTIDPKNTEVNNNCCPTCVCVTIASTTNDEMRRFCTLPTDIDTKQYEPTYKLDTCNSDYCNSLNVADMGPKTISKMYPHLMRNTNSTSTSPAPTSKNSYRCYDCINCTEVDHDINEIGPFTKCMLPNVCFTASNNISVSRGCGNETGLEQVARSELGKWYMKLCNYDRCNHYPSKYASKTILGQFGAILKEYATDIEHNKTISKNHTAEPKNSAIGRFDYSNIIGLLLIGWCGFSLWVVITNVTSNEDLDGRRRRGRPL